MKITSNIENKVDLPHGWTWVSLGEICHENNGIVDGPFGSNLKVSDYINDPINGVPVLTTKNLEGDYSPENVRFISKEKFESLKRSQVIGGDILVAKIGSIGKSGIYPFNRPTAIIPANLLKLTIIEEVVSRSFVFNYINSDSFQKTLVSISTATAQPAFNVTKFRDLKIPLPPLPEQHRIVEKLERLFARLTRAEAALAAAEAALERYRQSVLNTAFKAEDEEGNLKDGWKWVKLGELCSLITKGSSPSWQGINYVSKEEVLFVTSENVRENYLDLTTPKYVEFGFNDKQKRSILKKGDVLLNIVGASIGRAAIFNLENLANINQAVCIIRPSEKLFNKFLSYFLNSSAARSYYDNTKVDVARANLSLKDVNELEIPFSNFSTQENIVEKVENALDKASNLYSTMISLRDYCAKLRQSILQEAFSGRLMPQVASDEPASALIERIKSARNQQERSNKQRGKSPSKNIEKKMAKLKEGQPILDILRASDGVPVKAQTVWLQSEFKDSIDKFYEALKVLIEVEKTVKETREGDITYLILNDENR